jgi:CxxC motif-containing protein (DUF1111 family)
MGIVGETNREGNAGTITRFGWKAQNKSLVIFAGEAYLVEQGVSNELFGQKRGEPGDRGFGDRGEPRQKCLFTSTAEDQTNFDANTTTGVMSDTVGFAVFMQLLAPPQPSTGSASAQAGKEVFNQVGCGLCHTPSLQTGKSSIAALSDKKANLYSDLLIHHMGEVLADNVSQGDAAGNQFRTAPLWGVGQRIFFLHDGRSKDLVETIRLHASRDSEANAVVHNFNSLPVTKQQNVIDFLRSL